MKIGYGFIRLVSSYLMLDLFLLTLSLEIKGHRLELNLWPHLSSSWGRCYTYRRLAQILKCPSNDGDSNVFPTANTGFTTVNHLLCVKRGWKRVQRGNKNFLSFAGSKVHKQCGGGNCQNRVISRISCWLDPLWFSIGISIISKN